MKDVKPYCKINDVEITDKTSLTWSYTAGTAYNELNVIMPKADAEKLWAVKPYGITITMYDFYAKKRIIKNLSVVDIERDNWLKSSIKIVDPRYYAQYLRWVGRYNMKGIVNDFELIGNAPVAAQDWWMYPEYTWKYWSVKKGKAPNWDNQTPPLGTPYTTLELADKIMTDIYGELYGGIKKSEHYVEVSPDDLEFVTQPVNSVIQMLLGYAYADICFDTDNKLHIFCVEDDYNQQSKIFKWQTEYRTQTDLAAMEIHRYSKMRPSVVRVIFKKEQEIIVEVGNDGEGGLNQTVEAGSPDKVNLKPDTRNVIRVPRNMPIGGVDYKRGTYVQIDKLMKDLNITHADMCKCWRDPTYLLYVYCEKNGYVSSMLAKEHPILYRLVMGLRQDYRLQYQINPEWMSKILSLQAVRASIIDRVTQTRQPSLVWSNYSGALKLRLPGELLTERYSQWGYDRMNAEYDIPAEALIKATDEDANNAMDAPEKLSDWQVSIVNSKLGIIRFSPIVDLQLETIEKFPSILNDIPYAAVETGWKGWTFCDLNSKHRAITVLTGVFAVPNDVGCMYYKDVPVEDIGLEAGEYPNRYEYRSTRMNARFDYAGKLVDQELIDNLAHGEALKALRFLKDRIEGDLKLPGDFDLAMFGFCKSISYSFEGGGIKTKIHIPQTPAPIELYSLLGKFAKKTFGEVEKDIT